MIMFGVFLGLGLLLVALTYRPQLKRPRGKVRGRR
jgi:hypothetical protein